MRKGLDVGKREVIQEWLGQLAYFIFVGWKRAVGSWNPCYEELLIHLWHLAQVRWVDKTLAATKHSSGPSLLGSGLQTLLNLGGPSAPCGMVQIGSASTEGVIRNSVKVAKGWLSSLWATVALQASKSAACRTAELWFHCCCGIAVVLVKPLFPRQRCWPVRGRNSGMERDKW